MLLGLCVGKLGFGFGFERYCSVERERDIFYRKYVRKFWTWELKSHVWKIIIKIMRIVIKCEICMF